MIENAAHPPTTMATCMGDTRPLFALCPDASGWKQQGFGTNACFQARAGFNLVSTTLCHVVPGHLSWCAHRSNQLQLEPRAGGGMPNLLHNTKSWDSVPTLLLKCQQEVSFCLKIWLRVPEIGHSEIITPQTWVCLQQFRHRSLHLSSLLTRRITSTPTWEDFWMQKAVFFVTSQMSQRRTCLFRSAVVGCYF